MNREVLIPQLQALMNSQIAQIKELLALLEEQHKYIAKNDIFNMEAMVEKIQECNKLVANGEIKRRELTKGLLEEKTFGNLIEELKYDELDNSLRNLRVLLEEVRLQKDTNELLIKQGLSFTNRMLIMLNPDRQAKTYNGYGKIQR
jgi:flagellar biosynthesis/type III secretory pathway chaperone